MGRIALQEDNREDAIKGFWRAAEGFLNAGESSEYEDTLTELSQLYSEAGDYVQAYKISFEKSMYIRTVLQERGIVL
jgi:hypothetical protein